MDAIVPSHVGRGNLQLPARLLPDGLVIAPEVELVAGEGFEPPTSGFYIRNLLVIAACDGPWSNRR
jgi:hypothetical protein